MLGLEIVLLSAIEKSRDGISGNWLFTHAPDSVEDCAKAIKALARMDKISRDRFGMWQIAGPKDVHLVSTPLSPREMGRIKYRKKQDLAGKEPRKPSCDSVLKKALVEGQSYTLKDLVQLAPKWVRPSTVRSSASRLVRSGFLTKLSYTSYQCEGE